METIIPELIVRIIMFVCRHVKSLARFGRKSPDQQSVAAHNWQQLGAGFDINYRRNPRCFQMVWGNIAPTAAFYFGAGLALLAMVGLLFIIKEKKP